MRRIRPILLGLLLGTVFSLVLNAGSLAVLVTRGLTVSDLGAHLLSADEVYYFALIRDVRDGHPNLGNASFIEHADAPSVAGYALLPQGLLHAIGVPLPIVILLGDIMFTAVITLLVFLIAFRLSASRLQSSVFALSFMMWWGSLWLRTMNPQVTMMACFGAILLIVSDRDCRFAWCRGALLGVLFLLQPILAAYVITVEVLDALRSLFAGERLRSVVIRRLPIALLSVLAAAWQSSAMAQADPAIVADLLFRRGLILSRLPTAPLTQVLLLTVAAFWSIRLRRGVVSDMQGGIVTALLLAGIVVLNQSVVHGRDAVFGLYYRTPLAFALSLGVFVTAVRFVPQKIVLFGLGVVTAFSLSFFIRDFRLPVPQSSAEKAVADVLAAVEAMPDTSVILAPIDVSNLVPVLTSKYTLFTQYAHFEYVSDRELAERYLVLQSFFPLLPEHLVEGHPLVFGIGAGNLYARAKLACRLGLRRDCDNLVLSDFIRHQDVRQFTERGTVERISILRKYGVDTIVTDKPLPIPVQSHCREAASSGPYDVYTCAF